MHSPPIEVVTMSLSSPRPPDARHRSAPREAADAGHGAQVVEEARPGAGAANATHAAARSWHASSLELREGLEVTEHVSLDTLPAEWADSLRGA